MRQLGCVVFVGLSNWLKQSLAQWAQNVAMTEPASTIARWIHAMQWIIADTLMYARLTSSVFGPRIETLFVASKPSAAHGKFMAGMKRPIVVL